MDHDEYVEHGHNLSLQPNEILDLDGSQQFFAANASPVMADRNDTVDQSVN